MAKFSVLFPAFSEALREPDPEFCREAHALEALGVGSRVVNIQALINGDVPTALRFFGEARAEPVIYRGPILHPEEYRTLYEAVLGRGCRMLVSPEQYQRTLLFPEFFPLIADCSFPAAWVESTDPALALEAARKLGTPPYFIKDYSKSAKEIWPEGCVVENEEQLDEQIQKLVAYRGSRFEGGIVIRPLIRLRYIGENPFGGNLYEEYRLFFFDGFLISKTAYDRVGGPGDLPDYSFLPKRIPSPFFTADVVVTEAGDPCLLEIGDGGSSALPPSVSAVAFYQCIFERIKAMPR